MVSKGKIVKALVKTGKEYSIKHFKNGNESILLVYNKNRNEGLARQFMKQLQ